MSMVAIRPRRVVTILLSYNAATLLVCDDNGDDYVALDLHDFYRFWHAPRGTTGSLP